MTDLLLRQVAESRAGAEGQHDFDVIGPDGLVIGRIFKAATSPRCIPLPPGIGGRIPLGVAIGNCPQWAPWTTNSRPPGQVYLALPLRRRRAASFG